MRASLAASAVILAGFVLVALGQTMAAPAPEVRAKGTFFFSANVYERDSSNILCGEKDRYNLTVAPPPTAKAFLGRSVLEALSCDTNWDYEVKRGFTITGDVEAFFPLGCDKILGLIQNVQALQLESVGVTLLKNDAVAVSNVHYVANPICSTTTPYSVGVIMTDIGDKGTFLPGDLLTVRINLRAVNTDPAILQYWYLGTGAASVSAPGLIDAPPSPAPTGTGGTTTPTGTGGTSPTGTGTTGTGGTTGPTGTGTTETSPSGTEPSPTNTTAIPFFPSSASIALGTLGALGGVWLVWARRRE